MMLPQQFQLPKTAIASLGDTPTDEATEAAVDPTDPVETPIMCDPIHPGSSTVQSPTGAALSLSASPEQLDLLDFQGVSQGTIALPGLSWRESDQIHLASTNVAIPASIPTIYHSLIMGGQILKLSENSVYTDLYQIPFLITLTGIDGGNFVAYSTSDYKHIWWMGKPIICW